TVRRGARYGAQGLRWRITTTGELADPAVTAQEGHLRCLRQGLATPRLIDIALNNRNGALAGALVSHRNHPVLRNQLGGRRQRPEDADALLAMHELDPVRARAWVTPPEARRTQHRHHGRQYLQVF